jgi:hypothetical protein
MPDPIEERLALDHLMEVLDTQFLNVASRDKPDFFLRHRGSDVGVEVTDASAREFRWAMDIAQKKTHKGFHCGALENLSESQERTKSDLVELMKTPQCVDSELSAVAWARRAADCIKEKCRLMNKGEFERFEQNWLLVYNVQSDDCSIEASRCRDMLLGALGPDPDLRRLFDVIYVLSHSNLIVLDPNQTIARDLKPKI